MTSHFCIPATAHMFSVVVKTDELKYYVRFNDFMSQDTIKNIS